MSENFCHFQSKRPSWGVSTVLYSAIITGVAVTPSFRSFKPKGHEKSG